MKTTHSFGHRPPEFSERTLGMGWISGVRRLEFSAAKTSYWHRHEETTLLGCLKGEVSYEFHGIKPITLSSGSFLVIPAHAEHRHLNEVDPVSKRIELLLNTSPRKVRQFSLLSSNAERLLHTLLLKHALTPVKCTKDLQFAFSELYDLAAKPAKSLSELEIGYVRLLLTRILYGVTMPKESHADSSPMLMDKILDWLEAHANEPMSIDRIAAKMGFSRTHIFTLFKKHTGLTPADYTIRLRIKKACELLKRTDVTSKAVAECCGFATPSTFNAVFKRQTGLTPTQWREKQVSTISTMRVIQSEIGRTDEI